MDRFKLHGFVLGLLVFAVAASAACSSDDDPLVPDAAPDAAQLRVVHAAPDAPPIDVFLAAEATPIISGLSFGETSELVAIDTGTQSLVIRAAGAGPGEPPVFETDTFSVPDGARVTAIAAGTLVDAEPDEAFRVLPLVEAFSPAPADTARVRVVHAGADAPTVTAEILDNGDIGAVEIDRFAATDGAGIEVPAGTPLRITLDAGEPLERVTSFTTPELAEGDELFLIVTGLVGALPRQPEGLSILAVDPRGTVGFVLQDPSVFVMHASPDAGPAEIFANELAVTEVLEFAEVAGPIQVSPGTYTVTVVPTTDGVPSAQGTLDDLEAGQRYLVIAAGYVTPAADQPVLELITVRDEFALDDVEMARVRVVHASPDAPPVNVTAEIPGKDRVEMTDGLGFGEASEVAGVSLAPGEATFAVIPADGGPVVAAFEVPLLAAERAFVVVVGALSPAPGEPGLRAVLVDTTVFPWTTAQVASGI
jgi:hypothetical protein